MSLNSICSSNFRVSLHAFMCVLFFGASPMLTACDQSPKNQELHLAKNQAGADLAAKLASLPVSAIGNNMDTCLIFKGIKSLPVMVLNGDRDEKLSQKLYDAIIQEAKKQGLPASKIESNHFGPFLTIQILTKNSPPNWSYLVKANITEPVGISRAGKIETIFVGTWFGSEYGNVSPASADEEIFSAITKLLKSLGMRYEECNSASPQ